MTTAGTVTIHVCNEHDTHVVRVFAYWEHVDEHGVPRDRCESDHGARSVTIVSDRLTLTDPSRAEQIVDYMRKLLAEPDAEPFLSRPVPPPVQDEPPPAAPEPEEPLTEMVAWLQEATRAINEVYSIGNAGSREPLHPDLEDRLGDITHEIIKLSNEILA